jgi:hypothetical protein
MNFEHLIRDTYRHFAVASQDLFFCACATAVGAADPSRSPLHFPELFKGFNTQQSIEQIPQRALCPRMRISE